MAAPEPWWRQLEADSPCLDVNLLDGLEESDTSEVHALFACLDHHGHLEPLRPIDVAFEASTRQGRVGVEVARTLNGMTRVDLDPFSTGARVLEIAEHPEVSSGVGDLFLELAWAQPAHEVRAGGAMDSDLLESGVLVPASRLIPGMARTLHDDPVARHWLADGLGSEGLRQWVFTADGLARSTDPGVASIMGGLIQDGGEAVLAMRSPENDVWVGASGDSLRDLVDAIRRDDTREAVTPSLLEILGDDGVGEELGAALTDLEASGDLALFLPELKRLATVDRQGRPLQPGGVSALEAFVRLLSRANQPMTCTIDLLVTDVEISLGNLSVRVLEIVADMDPENVQSSASLLSSILGAGVTEFVVGQVADSGVCEPLDAEMLEDLGALEVMQDETHREVFVVLVRLLHVLKYGDDNRIPAAVNLGASLYEHDVIQPLSEVVIDTANTPFVARAVGLVPVLANPGAFDVGAGPYTPVELSDVLAVATWLLEPDNTGTTGWDRAGPLLEPVLADENSWTVVRRLAEVAALPDSRLSHSADLLPHLVDVDPDLTVLQVASTVFADDRVAEPLARALENEAFVNVVFASQPQNEQSRVPMAYAGELIVDGSFAELVRTVDAVLDLVGQSNM